jgi:hypothetical protein
MSHVITYEMDGPPCWWDKHLSVNSSPVPSGLKTERHCIPICINPQHCVVSESRVPQSELKTDLTCITLWQYIGGWLTPLRLFHVLLSYCTSLPVDYTYTFHKHIYGHTLNHSKADGNKSYLWNLHEIYFVELISWFLGMKSF